MLSDLKVNLPFSLVLEWTLRRNSSGDVEISVPETLSKHICIASNCSSMLGSSLTLFSLV